MEDSDTELRQYTHEQSIFNDALDIWELPLSSWTYYHKLRQMEWIVQIGFELKIYHPDEWSGMYQCGIDKKSRSFDPCSDTA